MKQFNVVPSPYDGRDYKAEAIYTAVKLPAIVDYRSEYLSIRDQGDQGSCAAMAGAAMKEWQEFKESKDNQYYSPQFIYNNREDTSAAGMHMRDLMGILNNLGDCQEPYCEYGYSGKPSDSAYEVAGYYRIKSYAAVDTVEGLKTALYNDGPCVIAVPVYNYSQRMWKQEFGDTFLGGHAMAIVGYNSDGFIIRNSWGYNWGDGGYCIFPYEDWGYQWEVWTTIDADSDYVPEPVPDKPWYLKYWWSWLIVLGVVLTIILTFTGCNLHGDNDPLDLRVAWDANPPDQDVTHYEIYWWQGDDTLNWNPTYLSMIDTVVHTDTDSIVSPYFTVTFNYVRSGVKAVNAEGISDMGTSRFYSYFEFAAPSPPLNPRVIR